MNFNKIADIRQNNELTQHQLAQIIGGNRVSISNWENAREIPNITKANSIADHFNVSLDYLFNLSKEKNYPDNILNQRLLYVALTRALHSEYIIAEEELSKNIKFEIS